MTTHFLLLFVTPNTAYCVIFNTLAIICWKYPCFIAWIIVLFLSCIFWVFLQPRERHITIEPHYLLKYMPMKVLHKCYFYKVMSSVRQLINITLRKNNENKIIKTWLKEKQLKIIWEKDKRRNKNPMWQRPTFPPGDPAVLSAMRGLTSRFGMALGMTLSLTPPQRVVNSPWWT